MATNSSSEANSRHLHCTTIRRFSTEDNCHVFCMDLQKDGRRMAVSGYNEESAFLDLFSLDIDSNSHEKPLLSSQPTYSVQYEIESLTEIKPYVCFLNDNLLVTFGKNAIILYDCKSGQLIKQTTLFDQPSCMTTRDDCIYVSFENTYLNVKIAKEVYVFDIRLNKIRTITLRGLNDRDNPIDLIVNGDQIFYTTTYGNGLLFNASGDVEKRYKPHVLGIFSALSLTFNEVIGLVVILWGDEGHDRVVAVYLPSGGHYLATFNVPRYSMKIRINSNINKFFVVTKETGEVYEYDTRDIFTFDDLLTCLSSFIAPEDQSKLYRYFKVQQANTRWYLRGSHLQDIYEHLRKTGRLSAEELMEACYHAGLSEAVEVISVYQKIQSKYRTKQHPGVIGKLQAMPHGEQQYNKHVVMRERDRQQLKERPKAAEQEKQELTDQLNKMVTDRLQATQERLQKIEADCIQLTQSKEEMLKELGGSKKSLKVTKDELAKYQLKFARESMALEEVLKHTREDMYKSLSPVSAHNEESFPEERESLDLSRGSSLAADYGRLMVGIAENLTLDITLRLATLFGLPPAETDMLRRVSFLETPGITLLNFMRTRNIINMYDLTNLQKGLILLQMNRTNENLIVPYQSKIDPFHFEENQAPKLLDWPTDDYKASPFADDGPVSSHESEERDTTEQQYEEASLRERTDDLTTSTQVSSPMRLRRHHPYIEHKINCEGGTISITGVRLTIPDDALPNDHVIAVNVIYNPEIHLPGGVERGRMTPLIKLEPGGLNLHKTASLIIPHSAIIPEPDRHSVIVFFGQKTERETGGEITWTEEKSLCWKLDSEKITLDINILSYVFVNLVSQETEQRHTFRVVPFIDAIVDAKDDVLITVCCCRDIDEEYKLLLEDQQSKLSLGSFATFQISRTFRECGDDTSYVELLMSSEDDSYQVTDELSKVKVDHLCAASRTTHQFRLKKIQDGDTDVVDVKLKVSQDEKNRISIILQSKVKDILLSPESKGMICKDVQPDLQEYQKLIWEVSTRMDKQHCENLAMCFNLSPAENEMIIKDAEPGKILLKILDERELIMPDKLIILYEGLKVIHLNKVARLVLEYIDTRRSKGQEYEGETGEIEKGQQEQEMTPGKDSKHARNIKILMEEGYTRLNIQRALRLSHGKLDLGRRVLQLVKHEHERLPLFPGSNLYREQYIDQQGGDMVIAGVNLIVPPGALQTGRIVSITVSADSAIQGPISKESLRLTPFVKFGPENLTLQKPVTLIIPHCALALSNCDVDVYSGALQPDKTLKWSLENVTCSMNAHQLEVKTQKPCLLGLHVPYKPKMKKRICVIPIMKRVSNLEDDLTVSLWFYNDDKLEYDSLINEEVYNQRGIELHNPISILIESWTSSMPVTITSNNLQCTPHPGSKKVDVDMETLWLQNRHEVSLLLQNKGIRDDFSLKIESKYGILRKVLFQFHIQLKVDRLLCNDQIVSPFQHIIPEYIIGSYHQLKQNLSTHLDADQSTQLANVFQLPQDVVANIGKHRSPGPILLETLTKASKISPANISALENALTEQGNEECAKLIRYFRKENPVVEATMCPKMSI